MTETIIILHKEVLANPKILKERFAGIISHSSFNGLNITVTKDWSYLRNKGTKNKYILNINPEFSLKDSDIYNIVKIVSENDIITHIDQYYSLQPYYIFGEKTMTNTFDSTDDEKRIANNPEPLKDYTGPDDVSRLYRQLSEDEKKAMGDVKEMSQLLINKIREVCGDNEYRKEAIKSIQMGQMWAVKDITSVDKA